MQTLIEGYRSFPGDHCGSVAMRGLLHHYCGLELPESAVFGLGAGVDCVYLETPGMDPAVVLFGRTATMEVDVAAALGIDYTEQAEPDDDEAWRVVREEVLAGRPTMLSGDILYLDYREFKVHFPGHRFVLLGFDDDRQVVQIADRIREQPEDCSYGALFESRNPKEGISTLNLWGRFGAGDVRNDLVEAARIALRTCSGRMLGTQSSGFGNLVSGSQSAASTGLAGIERLAKELPGWGDLESRGNLASYNASCIEKFGNGGGNFRRLYAGFLAWARELDSDLVPDDAAEHAIRAADQWTALAHLLWSASEGGDTWREASTQAATIAATERALFERLASRVGASA